MSVRTLLLLFFISTSTSVFAQFKSDCTDLAEQTNLDQLIYDGFETIPPLTESEIRCIARYHAMTDMAREKFQLLDRESEPLFYVDGKTICELSKYNFNIFVISDLLHSDIEKSVIQLFTYHYNSVMFQEIKQNLSEKEIDNLLYTKKKLGPYVLKERLESLAYGKGLVSLEKEPGDILRVKINTKKMFQGLDITYQDLNFVIIDENDDKNRFELGAKEVMNKGFILSTEFIRGNSLYWFDFRIRIDYNKLIENGEIDTCEKVNDYLFQFVHLTITKDYRIVPHNH